ncbi:MULTISPECIES: ElyC/SanA/YdcF family protein [Colwellia]|uniref:Membrane protein n=1 Tax=Colwellia marinimaniae TaxID=1513592 RepID=A0ABQ0MX67_9GAMM|nr:MULTISPECIES: ElyC/SanA/YdcF family protein [Colwellia]GAW96928.1 membrane protein [Colwellia marinimaniae]
MDLFLLKKIITVLIMPINIVLLLLVFALFLHGRNPKKSIKSLSAAIFILLISAFPPFSDTVMTAIENDYPAYVSSNDSIDYIVVLGCRHTNNSNLPVTSQLGTCSLQRMVEALRLYQLHPEARIITSGYGGHNPVSNAETVKQSLILLGVPAQKIITENFPKDTEEEAELIAPRVQGTKIILVTNANHMPRAMNYFQAQGIYPIAAPTGYWVKNPDSSKSWVYYVPDSKKLQQSTIAWYESLGLLVQWFKSLFN